MLVKFTLAALASALAAADAPKWSIDAATRTFRDEEGRARIFHGFNVVVKKPDYLPIEDHFDFDMSITDEDLQFMQDWGTKIVRLGVMWESVERQPGVYDYAYLDKVDALINRFGDYGIAVIVDDHQDLFSRKLCGEGVPHFYTPEDVDHKCPFGLVGTFFRIAGRCVPLDSYNFDLDEEGLPLLEECQQHSFEDMYTAPEVASAFSALYKNKDGLQDKLFAFWTEVATRFNQNPNVIGFDIFNEPWPANMYYDASLFFKPRKFDRTLLYPMAQRADQTIRSVADDKIVFFEGAQFPDTQPFLGGKTLELGFPETPGGADYLDRQVLNDHTYCCQAAGSMCDEGEPPLEKSDTCRAFHKQKVLKRAEDAKRYGIPLLFSEFGACFDGERCATEIVNSADAFDQGLSSWAYWQYKSFGDFTTTGGTKEGMFNPDGTPQDLKLRAIARTYAHAFQGEPENMFFQSENASFKTSFHIDKRIGSPTEIYWNEELFYPDGYKMVVTNQKNEVIDFTTNKVTKNYMSVQVSNMNALINGELVKINMTPVMPASGQATGSLSENGYSLAWTAVDGGVKAECSFSVVRDGTVSDDVKVELVDEMGRTRKVKNGEVEVMPCTYMSGGSIRVFEKRAIKKDKTLVETTIPFVNGADFTFELSKDAISQASALVKGFKTAMGRFTN